MKNTLYPILTALALIVSGCSKTDIDPPLVTDLEIQNVEILNPADRAAFCAGTGSLTVRLTGFEFYWDDTRQKKKKIRDFVSKPGIATHVPSYVDGKRTEPCGNFDIALEHLDPTPGVPSYGTQAKVLNDQCQIRLYQPVTGPAGSVLSAEVTNKIRMSDSQTFKGKFKIPCP